MLPRLAPSSFFFPCHNPALRHVHFLETWVWRCAGSRIVRRSLNPGLELEGVLLTMFDGRTNFSTQVAQEVRRHFPGKVLSTVVPRNVRLSEAPSHGLPVTAYDRSSKGAVAYRAIAAEIKERL
jgi:chromosome partitioning protein